MATTKLKAYLKKNYAQILFFATIFFTSCVFSDTGYRLGRGDCFTIFFIDVRYIWLKAVLSFVLPLAATLIFYLKEKSAVCIGDVTAVVMTAFSVCFVADALGPRLLWLPEKTRIVYHLGYALITYFTVFLTMSVLAFISKQGIRGYRVFCRVFFTGFFSVFLVCFITIYFSRDYGTAHPVNLVPFQGEFKFIREHGITIEILRDIGNVAFFAVTAMMIVELAKKHNVALGILLPVIFSAAMEVFQLYAKCGDPDVDDIIANVLGTVAGILFYKLIIEKLKEKRLC